ncbi:MAG: L-rhamnose mutarotase [Clostridiales Family XIII bacterium]|jgi:L-rhamnose mutarotase|nr:L-rhamnose mutarotase [Clostridiales Family XIII bacterium]
MKKYLCVIEVKPECREEYIAIHKAPWPGMLDAIHEAGYLNEVIWYYKDQSIIYLELPDDLPNEVADARLRATDVCKQWDITVCPWFSKDPAMPEKIFDLNQQRGGGALLPD